MKRNKWSVLPLLLMIGVTSLGVWSAGTVAVDAAAIPIIKEGDGHETVNQPGYIMGNKIPTDEETKTSGAAKANSTATKITANATAKADAAKSSAATKAAVTKQEAASKAETAKSEASKSQASKSQTDKTSEVKSGKIPAFMMNEDTKIPQIRILIGTRSSSFVATGTGSVSVYDENKKPMSQVTTGQAVVVGLKNKKLTVNGKTVDGDIYLKSWQGKTSTPVKVDGKPYRGAIKVMTGSGGGMLIINETSLESYLYGVVPAEAVPSWHQEALKAQAVAARTYALYTMKQSSGKVYDVKPTTDNQVYNGQAGEYDSTNKAVDATKGMVMMYKGSPIQALFHADGGGYTEDSVNVWGSEVPYLKGVKDYANNGDTSAWTVTLTRKAMEDKLKAAGKDVGTLKDIKLSTLRKRPIKAADRGVSGRVIEATFVGNKKSITVGGESIMKIFGLKSTLFDFYVNAKPPTSADSFKNPKAYHTFKKATDTVYIRGYGWGHGLGLSQWGAAAMAAKDGNKADYYKTILNHYYTGITIEKMY